ncbi:MAG: 30S ribosomal protein S17 [Thermoprotei archaeon]
MPLNSKSVGIPNVAPPTRECADVDCPYHGHLKVRGMVVQAAVIQKRASKMLVVEREYAFYDRKYQRYERRRSRIRAHLPLCVDAEVGDRVVVGETRPVSKSVSFVVLGKAGAS